MSKKKDKKLAEYLAKKAILLYRRDPEQPLTKDEKEFSGLVKKVMKS